MEISGNWTKERLPTLEGIATEPRQVGVSMGALTHSTQFVDFSMNISKK